MISVSVIIPVYNTEEFLGRAIESVCTCSLEEIEIIIVDDASPGPCRSIVEGYQVSNKKIRYLRHPKNQGTLSSRYTGTMAAKGEFVAYLDPDDWVVDDIYTHAYHYAIKNNLEVVWFNFTQSDETGRSWEDRQNTLQPWGTESGSFFLEQIFKNVSRSRVWHVSWNKLIRTEVAQSVFKSLNVSNHLSMYEDLLWSITLFSHLYDRQGIGILEQTGVVYYRHSKSITKRKDLFGYKKKYHNMVRIIQTIREILRRYDLDRRYASEYKRLKCFLLYNLSPWRQSSENWDELLSLWSLRIYHIFFWSIGCIGYNQINDEMNKIVRKVKVSGVREVGIFGTGDFARCLSRKLAQEGVKTLMFISTDLAMMTQYIDGIDIGGIRDGIRRCRMICISSIGAYDEISALILSEVATYPSPLLITVE